MMMLCLKSWHEPGQLLQCKRGWALKSTLSRMLNAHLTRGQRHQHPCLPQAALQEAVQDGPQTKTAAGGWEAAGEPFV